MKGLLLSFTLLALLSMGACDQPAEINIIGSWRMDSIYDNYNGFSFTNTNPYPREIYEYRKNNTVLRKGMGEQLEYRYTCNDSILSISEASGGPSGEFVILHIDQQKMALKKIKKPLFAGKNQVRFEIRYFTRIDSTDSEH